MNPNPELAAAFEKAKKQLHDRGLTPRHPLKRKSTMGDNTETTNTTEAAPARLAKKSKTADKPAKAEKADKKGGYSANDFAKDLGVSSVELRKALRGLGEKKPDGGRWNWANKTAAAALGKRVTEWIETDARKDNAGRPTKAATSKKTAAKGGDGAKTPAKKQPARKVATAKMVKKAK